MSVTLKESNGSYYGRVRLSGVEKTISLGTKSLIVAQGRIAEVKTVQREIIAGVPLIFSWESGAKGVAAAFPTVSAAVTEFLKVKQAEGLREKSVSSYSDMLAVFTKWIGLESTIDKISQQAVNSYKMYLMEYERELLSGEIRTLSKSTINSYMLNLKIFLEWLSTAYNVQTVAVKKLRIPKEIKYIPQRDLDSICQAAAEINPLLARVYEMYGRLGMRLNEAYLGTVSDMTLRVSAEKAKGHRGRVISLMVGDRQTIEEMRLVYSSERISRLFKKVCLSLNLPYHFHQLRATAGVKLYVESRDIFYVKYKLGHADTKMTELYLELDITQLAEDFPKYTELKKVKRMERMA